MKKAPRLCWWYRRAGSPESGTLLCERHSLGVACGSMSARLESRAVEVETPFGRVALKIAELPEGGERAAPEFESVRAVAERTGRPLREVSEAALTAWREQRE